MSGRNFLSWLYAVARVLGDARAVGRGRYARRLATRHLLYKPVFRAGRRLWK